MFILDDLDSSNVAKALSVMGFDQTTKGTFKHGMRKQVLFKGHTLSYQNDTCKFWCILTTSLQETF